MPPWVGTTVAYHARRSSARATSCSGTQLVSAPSKLRHISRNDQRYRKSAPSVACAPCMHALHAGLAAACARGCGPASARRARRRLYRAAGSRKRAHRGWTRCRDALAASVPSQDPFSLGVPAPSLLHAVDAVRRRPGLLQGLCGRVSHTANILHVFPAQCATFGLPYEQPTRSAAARHPDGECSPTDHETAGARRAGPRARACSGGGARTDTGRHNGCCAAHN